jgi:hypothetical protein
MFFGQMDATPAIRSMVAPAAATAAEYFRDDEGRDILFFVDNIYRHVQAMTEMSTNLGDLEVYRFDMTPQTGELGYGASWHPSLLQQQRMADELTPFLRKLMSWTD